MPFEVYLEPQGFLGTGASLLADLTLVAYILLIVPAMLVGWVFARRKMYRPAHKWVMIWITIINIILIAVLMITAYRFDVAENITRTPGNARYLLPTLHGILGLPAQILAIYTVYGMLREDARIAAAKKRGEKGGQLKKYFFRGAKPLMRWTLALWLATAALGVVSYLIRYDVLTGAGIESDPIPPVSTPEVETQPEGTPETDALSPEATDEIAPVSTPEMTSEVETSATRTPSRPLPTPEVTPELDPDDVERATRDAFRATEDALEDEERATRDAFRATEDAIDEATDAADDD